MPSVHCDVQVFPLKVQLWPVRRTDSDRVGRDRATSPSTCSTILAQYVFLVVGLFVSVLLLYCCVLTDKCRRGYKGNDLSLTAVGTGKTEAVLEFACCISSSWDASIFVGCR